jgi:hypothetical protein
MIRFDLLDHDVRARGGLIIFGFSNPFLQFCANASNDEREHRGDRSGRFKTTSLQHVETTAFDGFPSLVTIRIDSMAISIEHFERWWPRPVPKYG